MQRKIVGADRKLTLHGRRHAGVLGVAGGGSAELCSGKRAARSRLCIRRGAAVRRSGPGARAAAHAALSGWRGRPVSDHRRAWRTLARLAAQ